MEHEVLFRGKRLDNGEWVEGHLLSFKAGQINPNRSFILPFASSVSVSLGAYTFGGFVEVDPATVGQYTGLADRNGKKIFEGDIVRYSGTIHEVVFEKRNLTAYFGIVFGPNETWDFCASVPSNHMEVIGNRWDTPELLEVKK